MKEFVSDVRDMWRLCQGPRLWIERAALVTLLPVLFVAYWFYRFAQLIDPDK